MRSRIFTCVLMCSLSGPAFAWGYLAHEMIIRLAEPLFTEETRQALETLLPDESLPDAAEWADRMRSSQRDSEFWGYRHSASWHFVNTDPGKPYVPTNTPPEGDIVIAIKDFTGILTGTPPLSGPVYAGLQQYAREYPELPEPLSDKALALHFLIHLVADIHQPLHTGYGADSGGNSIGVEWFGRRTNMHAVWDTQLVRSLAPDNDALFSRLERELGWATDEELRLVADTDVDDWLAEGLLMRETVYASAEEGSILGSRYASAYGNVVRSQLLKAAIRTAATLNNAFSGETAIP